MTTKTAEFTGWCYLLQTKAKSRKCDVQTVKLYK